jgi:argininosuccinate synthase
MNTIVLAYSGGFASSNAIHWLAETCAADVVTVTLDVGQGDDLAVLRTRALACGARRAHAMDARDELVREFLLRRITGDALAEGGGLPIAELTPPLIARKLVEVAGIEGTSIVAHASDDESIDACLRAMDSSVRILAPAREWKMDAAQLSAYAHARGVPPKHPSDSHCRIDQNLWGRTTSFRDSDRRPGLRSLETLAEAARVDIRFENGEPVAINDVPMAPVELVESLALIAGRHGIGRLEHNRNGYTVVCDAPAAIALHAARTAMRGPNGVAQLSLTNGTCTVLPSSTEVVNLA